MTNLTDSKSCSEIQDLIMPYLEDLLTSEERSELEEHMRHCNNCAEELADKRRWSGMLEANREVMCPEPWELLEYAHDPNKESKALNIHLQHCKTCKEDYEAFLESSPELSMPEKLWERLSELTVTPEFAPERHVSLSQRLAYVIKRIQNLFSIQFLAFATVAATLLLVVIFYPLGKPEPVALLSSENWQSVLIKRNLMSPSVSQQERKRLAELVIIKDKGDLPKQSWIDSLYSELEPSEQSAEVFDWVTPAEISKEFAGKRLNMTDRKAMIQELGSRLNLTEALLITIKAGNVESTYDVDIELMSTKTGDTFGEEHLTNVQEKNLGAKANIAIRSLLNVN